MIITHLKINKSNRCHIEICVVLRFTLLKVYFVQQDQDLAQENSKYWFSTLNKIFKILKLHIKDLADNSVFRNNLMEYYHQQSDSQLQKIKSGAVDSKLILFSNIFISNVVPFYLETNLSKSIKSKITQLRISAHCLNIERGRYNKPKIPREERFCKFCTEVETRTFFDIMP